jgi:MFS family permease
MTDRQRHDPYAALRVPSFAAYLAGRWLMNIGTAGQSLAIGWEIYTRTDDELALGLVGLVQAVPMLLLTLPSGYLADVFDRRRLVILGLVGTTATSLLLAVFSYLSGPIWLMYLLLFLDACAIRLAIPAGAALMPQLVPEKVFENAVTWRTSLFQLSAVAGPAIGGLILWVWVPAAYLFSAACTTVFIVMMCFVHIRPGKSSPPGNVLVRLREGLVFVWSHKPVLGTISLDLFAVLLGGAVYLLPVFARDIIHSPWAGATPEVMLGLLRAAPAVGAGLTAVVLAHLPPMRKAGRAMLVSVALFGVATIVFGLSRSFWLSMAMLALTGAFDNVSVVVRHTLVQLATPNEMRGRVSAVNSVFIGSSNELGGFESGAVAWLFGPVVSVVSGGVGTIFVVGLWSKLFPTLRKLGRLADHRSRQVG